MNELRCPICGAKAEGGLPTGAAEFIICPQCGGYRLSLTALAMLEAGTLQKPQPERFADLVKRKRGSSTEYPTITSIDLGG